MSQTKPLPPVGFWVLVLAIVGFCAGFFGPMILRPEANQGPLLGIFMTGPGGALLGLVLGVVFRFLPVSNARRWQALIAASAMLAFGTLLFCLPPPEIQGELIEGVVTECRLPAELGAAATDEWEQRVAAAPWAQVRAGWQKDLPRMIATTPGVALTIDVGRRNYIQRHRKPWNRGRVDAQGWQERRASQQYFADFRGDSCEAYEGRLPILYLRYGQHSDAWPPDDLSNFLNLARVEEAPGGYLGLAAQPSAPSAP